MSEQNDTTKTSLLKILRGLSVVGIVPSIMNALPWVLSAIGVSADVLGIWTSTGATVSFLLLVAVISINVYIQYHLSSIDKSIENDKDIKSSQSHIRMKNYNKRSQDFERKVIFALVVLIIVGVLISGYYFMQIFDSINKVSEYVNNDIPLPRVLPYTSDYLHTWTTYEEDNFSLGEIQRTNDELFFDIVVDQNESSNRLLMATSSEDNPADHTLYLREPITLTLDKDVVFYINIRYTELPEELPEYFNETARAEFNIVKDREWHLLALIYHNGRYRRYIDDVITEEGDMPLSNIYSLGITMIPDSIAFQDNFMVWETTRDVIAEIENR